jgi:hypothetical protein
MGNTGKFVRVDDSPAKPRPHRESPAERPPTCKNQGLLPYGLDSGDILLFLILFFLYTESGDEDFLVILAVVAFSILKK